MVLIRFQSGLFSSSGTLVSKFRSCFVIPLVPPVQKASSCLLKDETLESGVMSAGFIGSRGNQFQKIMYSCYGNKRKGKSEKNWMILQQQEIKQQLGSVSRKKEGLNDHPGSRQWCWWLLGDDVSKAFAPACLLAHGSPFGASAELAATLTAIAARIRVEAACLLAFDVDDRLLAVELVDVAGEWGVGGWRVGFVKQSGHLVTWVVPLVLVVQGKD